MVISRYRIISTLVDIVIALFLYHTTTITTITVLIVNVVSHCYIIYCHTDVCSSVWKEEHKIIQKLCKTTICRQEI